jgi:hypothetical protein
MYFTNTHTPAHLQRIIVAYVRWVNSGLLNVKTRMVVNFHSFLHFTNSHTPTHLQRIIVAYVRWVNNCPLNVKKHMAIYFHSFYVLLHTHTHTHTHSCPPPKKHCCISNGVCNINAIVHWWLKVDQSWPSF